MIPKSILFGMVTGIALLALLILGVVLYSGLGVGVILRSVLLAAAAAALWALCLRWVCRAVDRLSE